MLELTIYKNYKSLCEAMDWKTTGGDTKVKNLKILESICKYHKEGQKFVIEEIYEEPKEIERKSSISYLEELKRLIMFYMYNYTNRTDGTCYPTLSQLAKACYLVNDNYATCKKFQEATSTVLSVDKDTTYEYFDRIDTKIEYRIEKALESLRKSYVLNWDKRYKIVKLQEGNRKAVKEEQEGTETTIEKDCVRVHSIATEREERIITDISYKYCRQYGCKNLSDAIRRNCYKQIMTCIKDDLLNIYNIEYFYYCYEIRYNLDNVKQDLESYNLTKEELDIMSVAINIAFGLDMTKSAEKSYKPLAMGEVKNKHRSRKNYVEDYKKLNDNVIDKNAENITKEVSKEQKANKMIEGLLKDYSKEELKNKIDKK